MSEFLITLINAPRSIQRSVALCGLALVLLCASLAIASLTSRLIDKNAQIVDLRHELFRLDQIIARKPSGGVAPTSADSQQLFIVGDSVSVVQAALQERLTSVSATSGANVASMSGAPQLRINSATYVGLRANFDGDLRAVNDVIRQLETSKPPLIIRSALIRTNNTINQGELREPIHLSAQILLYGAVNPSVAISDGTHP